MTRAQLIARVRQLADELVQTIESKNNDYGGVEDPFKNFREWGTLGFLVRKSDKAARLKTALVEKRELAVSGETVKDTLIDDAAYSLLLQCWLEDQRKPGPEQNIGMNGQGIVHRGHYSSIIEPLI